MQEQLRKSFHDIWNEYCEKGLSQKDYRQKVKQMVSEILSEDPQRLLDLAKGHINGLSDEELLAKAKKEPYDFIFMCISCGSWHFNTINYSDTPHPDSRKIKKVYRKLLELMEVDKNTISKLLNKTSGNPEYYDYPASVLLDILADNDFCVFLDWKSSLEDKSYCLNLIAKKTNLKQMKQYPPYEEGQVLGMESWEEIKNNCENTIIIVPDGDTDCAFLVKPEKADEIKKELDKIQEFMNIHEEVYIL